MCREPEKDEATEDAGEPDMAAASEAAFAEVWDNEDDAIYDRWREFYHVPKDRS